jgi:hypothetical protein
MGYQHRTSERLVRNDEATRFQTRGKFDRFRGNETTIFINDEIASSGVDDFHTGLKGRRKPPKWEVGSTSCWEA